MSRMFRLVLGNTSQHSLSYIINFWTSHNRLLLNHQSYHLPQTQMLVSLYESMVHITLMWYLGMDQQSMIMGLLQIH